MKPVIGMEGGKANIVTVTEMDVPDKVHVDASKGFSSKKIIVGVIVAVIALATVAAIVIVSVHFGAKITTSSVKVVRQTFKSDKGEVVEEETSVTKTEVDVRIPNVAEVIYDYKNGIVVTRFVNRESNVKSECLAQYMNETEAPNQDPEEYSDAEVDTYEDGDNEEEKTDKQEWVRTEDEVSKNLISDKVARACAGTKIYWLKKVQSHNDGIKKRQLQWSCPPQYRYYLYWCYRVYPYTCTYRCYFEEYCANTGMLLARYWGYGCGRYCYERFPNRYCPRRANSEARFVS